MEFKKGDRVRFRSLDQNFVSDIIWRKVGNVPLSEYFNLEDTYTISYVYENSYEIENCCVPKDYFELARETQNLKVGDKIEALVDFPSSGRVRKGEIGTIERVGNERCPFKVNFPSQSSYYISIKQILNTFLYTLVEEDKPYNLNPYVGEYLVVIKDTIFLSVPLKKGECIQIVGKGKWKKFSSLPSTFASLDIYTSDIFRTATTEEEIEFDKVYKEEPQIKPIDLEPIVPNIIVPIDRKKIKRTVGIIPTTNIIINRKNH